MYRKRVAATARAPAAGAGDRGRDIFGGGWRNPLGLWPRSRRWARARGVSYSLAVLRALALAGLILGASGCPKPEVAGSAGDGGPMSPWRRQLADSTIYPVRDGLRIDVDKLRSALLEGRRAHRDEVRAAVQASVTALADGEPPSERDYRVLATFEHEVELVVREVEGTQAALAANVVDSAQRFAMQYLVLAMSEDQGMDTATVGQWMLFFNVAEPAVRRCGSTETTMTVCLDYGSLDILVVDMIADDGLWLPRRLQWLQRQS